MLDARPSPSATIGQPNGGRNKALAAVSTGWSRAVARKRCGCILRESPPPAAALLLKIGAVIGLA
ncbi:hypothetical protein LJ655_14200 [Paraburkholderia sp. MMS20-SJTN17]|uniref:Uncharacterized protein n=1 Tax=Paraburkholderia translucens TaxID=2886945 RepID=A0ABS8KE51_9BURK|nr:hypothetical protein [Paraburkholderia sp. MMS20-SJTN17]MCC8403023.1 hypothetical protein [Paraburkholderia sp. MMS20-SJTN17]